jgi:molybdenum transport protein
MFPCALPDAELQRLPAEDVPYGDLTTEVLGIACIPWTLSLAARGAMTVCGTEETVRLLELVGARATLLVPSGSEVVAGTLLHTVRGSAGGVHRGGKVAEVLVEAPSGLAMAAAAICRALRAAGFELPVACTRKNFPGAKALAAKAVRAGEATLHRLGLSETLLLFPERRQFLAELPAATVGRVKVTCPEKKLVVEFTNPEEALVWAQAGADVLQLEKFAPNAVRHCVATTGRDGRRPLLGVAGGSTRPMLPRTPGQALACW